jgi:nicotinate-nucleotide adenylyltransferase
MKLGVLGGTFDPVHLGHLAIAGEAETSLGLDRVLLIPAGRPLLKPIFPATPVAQRLEMLRLAAAERPGFEVSAMEMERPGPSYTVDTIEELQRRHEGDEIYFILGWGSLMQIPEWKEPARLAAMCRLVAAPRPGYPRPDLEDLERRVPGIAQRVIWLDGPLMDISATAVRERLARGLPIDDLVPGPVAAYIKEHKLYTSR